MKRTSFAKRLLQATVMAIVNVEKQVYYYTGCKMLLLKVHWYYQAIKNQRDLDCWHGMPVEQQDEIPSFRQYYNCYWSKLPKAK